MKEIDKIPWDQLSHAYGSAEDVPGLLRKLETSPRESAEKDGGALWSLFGNIWHQGTVYEVTPCAVPFLIELAANPQTPTRIGILELLGEIAEGQPQEAEVAEKVCEAMDAGFDTIVGIANEKSDASPAALRILTELPKRRKATLPVLEELLKNEINPQWRAALILLLGRLEDRSETTLAILEPAAQSDDVGQRTAAAVSFARLQFEPMPPVAKKAIIEFLVSEDQGNFDGLPWDAESEIDCAETEMTKSLDDSELQQVIDRLIAEAESGRPTQVSRLVRLLFPRQSGGPTPQLTARDLSPNQKRAVQAMTAAMENGKRIFYGHFPSYGLPDSMREWRNLAAGRQPTEIDMSLPLLGEPDNPQKLLRPDSLKTGDRIHHRYFGIGIVEEIEFEIDWAELDILFEEEGLKSISLPSDGSQ